MSDYQLGQRVTFSEHIKRRSSRPGEFTGPNRIWSGEAYPGKRLEGGEGIIIGKRTLSNGDARWCADDSTIYEPADHFTAYLIAFDLHRKPVHVLPKHITIATPKPTAVVTVPAPHVPYPGPHDTDATFMRGAAKKIAEDYPAGGSNVKRAVIKLLNDAADAMEAQK